MAHPDNGHRPLKAPLLVAALVLLTGCTGAPTVPDASGPVTEGTSVAEPGPSCSPAPALQGGLPASFPATVALPAGAELTEVGEAGGFALANGRVAGTVEQALAHFRTALPDAGLFVGRDEDERRAGELTFLGGSTEGAVTVAALRCPADSVQFTISARRTR